MLFPPAIVQAAIDYSKTTQLPLGFPSELLSYLANDEHTPPLLAKYMELFGCGDDALKIKAAEQVIAFYIKVIAEMRPGRIDLEDEYYNPKPHVDKSDPLQHPRGITMLHDFYGVIVQDVFTLVEGRGVSPEDSVTHSS
jgi:hypothetical protein